MGELINVEKAVGQRDITSFDALMGAAKDECDKIIGQLADGKARLSRKRRHMSRARLRKAARQRARTHMPTSTENSRVRICRKQIARDSPR